MNKELFESVKLFNEGKYHESHDALEPLWLKTSGPIKQFYQGLIQVSVAMYLISEKKFVGAYKVFLRSKSNLEKFKNNTYEIDVSKLLTDLDQIFLHENYPDNYSENSRFLLKLF